MRPGRNGPLWLPVTYASVTTEQQPCQCTFNKMFICFSRFDDMGLSAKETVSCFQLWNVCSHTLNLLEQISCLLQHFIAKMFCLHVSLTGDYMQPPLLLSALHLHFMFISVSTAVIPSYHKCAQRLLYLVTGFKVRTDLELANASLAVWEAVRS